MLKKPKLLNSTKFIVIVFGNFYFSFWLYYNICTSGEIIYLLNLIRSRQTYYKISNLQIDIFRFSLRNLDRKRWKGKVQVVITVNGTNESENGSGILLSEKFQAVNKILCYHMTTIYVITAVYTLVNIIIISLYIQVLQHLIYLLRNRPF